MKTKEEIKEMLYELNGELGQEITAIGHLQRINKYTDIFYNLQEKVYTINHENTNVDSRIVHTKPEPSRTEIAAMVLSGTMADQRPLNKQERVKFSIEYADELIKQLNETQNP
tara:strand:- start:1533 stop:1871 length:339 start_codon:yes stop_codon:yes gene_type:complete